MGNKNNVAIDLHIHSNASDGSLTPHEILSLALRLKLGAIAITDHDTVAGSKEALDSGIPSSIQFLTGIEISANPPFQFACAGSFHILGYAIDLDHPELNQSLRTLQEARKHRNPKIIASLNRLGVAITLAEVQHLTGKGQIGRPHIAQLMLKRGYAASINDAFDRYLGKGKPCYVDKFRMDSAEAIRLIARAGGIPVLAHPFLIGLQTGARLEDLIVHLKSTGLRGIEVYYPVTPPEKTAGYIQLARKHGLFMTGGTDFHGSIKPDIQMGTGRGDFFIPYRLYEKLTQNH